MEEILEQLVELIGNAFPDWGTVDEDYGQLEMIDMIDRDTYPLTYPACLIDAADCSWSNVEGISQRGTLQVRVRLILDCYDDTHYRSGTVDKIRERSELRKQLHLLLQGHRYEGQELIRTSSRFYTQNHGIKVYESLYTVAVSEYITENLQPVSPGIKIAAKSLK